jgi:hypothetical protein
MKGLIVARRRLRVVVALGILVASTLGLVGTATAAPTQPNVAAALQQQGREILVRQPGVTPQAVYCWSGVVIRSNANGRYVSAELGYGGSYYATLRARATAVGPWERYTVCRDTSNGLTDFLSEANNRAVAAELGYPGSYYATLRARTSTSAIGPWELFVTPANPGGHRTWIASRANGRYVSAELGYGGSYYATLRARATALGPWESFTW